MRSPLLARVTCPCACSLLCRRVLVKSHPAVLPGQACIQWKIPQHLTAREDEQKEERGWRQPATGRDDQWLSGTLQAGRRTHDVPGWLLPRPAFAMRSNLWLGFAQPHTPPDPETVPRTPESRPAQASGDTF